MSRPRTSLIPAPRVKFEAAELRKIQQRVEKLFSVLEESLEFEGTKACGTFTPSIDLCETEEAICIAIDMPGIEPEDIELTVTSKDICIRGEKRHGTTTSKATSYICCERQFGKFQRHINLRWAININETTAELVNGTLRVLMPKLIDRRRRSIKIPINISS
ncbi:MAG: Hsp20/alpha crystallin family protein [Pyrinomonadaceae bacterium]